VPARERYESTAIGLETEFFNGQSVVRSKPTRSSIASRTKPAGGFFDLKKDSDLGASFTRIAQELRSQYLLGFQPGGARRQGPQAGSARQADWTESEEPPQLRGDHRRHDELIARARRPSSKAILPCNMTSDDA
jgi:hypothetical protein